MVKEYGRCVFPDENWFWIRIKGVQGMFFYNKETKEVTCTRNNVTKGRKKHITEFLKHKT